MNNSSNKLNSVNKKEFLTIPNMGYLLLISVTISGILISMLNIESVKNYFELFIVVTVISALVLYFLLVKKKLSLDNLETQSVIGLLVFILGVTFFILYLKFTSIDTFSTEGMMHAVIFCLLVFAFINFIFLLMGLAN